MSELRVYEVEVHGWPTTLQLTETDAAARGLTDEDTVEHRTAVREWLAAEVVETARLEAEQVAAESARLAEEEVAQRSAAEAPSTAEAEEAPAKGRTPANKSRTAANKGT
ncbi:hypothetical protein [Nocardia sp. MH4]|uniref:hypothetical protein n=1 Tax=Nocardia sp. MH4 TaxID=1768677 RepID=UPI001C4F4D8B|nr:hypothetical protein [Nocardia sp. MH4]